MERVVKKGIVSLKLANLAKELGYTEASEYYYDVKKYGLFRTPQGYQCNQFVWNSLKHTVSAPSADELRTWLRLHKNIDITISIVGADDYDGTIHHNRTLIRTPYRLAVYYGYTDLYTEVLLICLKASLEHLKKSDG